MMSLRHHLTRVLKRVLPQSLVRAIVYRNEHRYVAGLRVNSRAAVFEAIYRDGIWGGQAEGADFYSGSGSHSPAVVQPYVSAVTAYLGTLEHEAVVVEVGCGDFYVGSQLLPACHRYIACDIVSPLIERNRERFHDPRLTFEVVDAVKDPLPQGDVLIIRQVLQHLSNADIARIVVKFAAYKHVIVTEHLPSLEGFRPNIDKPTGFDIRLKSSSGVVLTDAPFHLAVGSARVLCEVPEGPGLVRTIAYKM